MKAGVYMESSFMKENIIRGEIFELSFVGKKQNGEFGNPEFDMVGLLK